MAIISSPDGHEQSIHENAVFNGFRMDPKRKATDEPAEFAHFQTMQP